LNGEEDEKGDDTRDRKLHGNLPFPRRRIVVEDGQVSWLGLSGSPWRLPAYSPRLPTRFRAVAGVLFYKHDTVRFS
jgi:hypothetical protein